MKKEEEDELGSKKIWKVEKLRSRAELSVKLDLKRVWVFKINQSMTRND